MGIRIVLLSALFVSPLTGLSCGLLGNVSVSASTSGGVDAAGALDAVGDVVSVIEDAKAFMEGAFLSATTDSFASISVSFGGGMTTEAESSEQVPERIIEIIEAQLDTDQAVDLVFVVDTTGSMGDHIAAVRRTMGDITDRLDSVTADWRVGITQYRDITDEPLSKTEVRLSADRAAIQSGIDGLGAEGGGDICEHVFAGLDLALEEQPWREGSSRHMILIGDAPAHTDYVDDPRNLDYTSAKAESLAVTVHTVTVGCNKICQAVVAEDPPEC